MSAGVKLSYTMYRRPIGPPLDSIKLVYITLSFQQFNLRIMFNFSVNSHIDMDVIAYGGSLRRSTSSSMCQAQRATLSAFFFSTLLLNEYACGACICSACDPSLNARMVDRKSRRHQGSSARSKVLGQLERQLEHVEVAHIVPQRQYPNQVEHRRCRLFCRLFCRLPLPQQSKSEPTATVINPPSRASVPSF